MRRILAIGLLAIGIGTLTATPALATGHSTPTATPAGWCCKT